MNDIIDEFINDTNEYLVILDQELITLENDPKNEAIIDNIFRFVHTIKGTSGFLGFKRLESVSHAAETVLSAAKYKKILLTPSMISTILSSLDLIREIIEHIATNYEESDGDDKDIIQQLEDVMLFSEDHSQGSNENDQAEVVFEGETSPDKISDIFTSADDTPQESPPPSEPAQSVNPAPEPPKSAANAPEETAPKKLSNQTIRVNLDTLENLIQVVSELVLTRNQLTQLMRNAGNNEHLEQYQGPVNQLSYITTELQEKIMKTRMQPIGNAWAQLPRMIRDLSMKLGKKIELKMVGEDTELDRQLLEIIKDPLIHMVRNSCDHGVEMPSVRAEKGKPETGLVTLSAGHEGGHILIEIIDDGAGLDPDRIIQKAVSLGLSTQSEMFAKTQQQVLQTIFRAGFSTASQVTDISGRGVGMDVVRTNIEKMGGTIEVSSEKDKFLKFKIKIPLTLAIVSVLIVETHGQKFALPQLNVQELVTAGYGNEHTIEVINDTPVLRLRGALLPLISLSETLGFKRENFDVLGNKNPTSNHNDNKGEETDSSNSNETHQEKEEKKAQHIVVCKVGSQEFGLIVERVYDTEEIVVKPVSFLLKDLPIYSGETILGDGSVIMILDPVGISKAIIHQKSFDDIAARHAIEMLEEKILQQFLMFRLSNGKTQAVPLELVSRLEDIPVENIELLDGAYVLQYREKLIQLFAFDKKFKLPESGSVKLIVFVYNQKNIGFFVNEILDIASITSDMNLGTSNDDYLGSLVINGAATDILDISNILAKRVSKSKKEKSSKKAAPKSSHAKKVLLVEDSPIFMNMTTRLLNDAGYEVITASHGHDALMILFQGTKDLDYIITDIDMPVMNGYELISICKSTPSLKHVPIIAFSGFPDFDSQNRAYASGCNYCVSKTDKMLLLQLLEDVGNISLFDDQPDVIEITKSIDKEKLDSEVTLLTMGVDGQKLCIPVESVRDVLAEQYLSPIPQAPIEIASSINLRGRIVTVINMRARLGIDAPYPDKTMFVVVEYKGEYFSLHVDFVEEVRTLKKSELEGTPPNLSPLWSKLSTGVYQGDKELLMIMDIEEVMNMHHEAPM